VLDAGPDRGAGAAAVSRWSNTLAGIDVLLHRLGWSVQVPAAAGGRAGRGGDREVAGGGLAGGKKTAADLGAWLVFEDESGQGLRPPAGRTWGRRGQTPVVRVTGGSNKRVSLAALIAGPAGVPAPADLPVHRGRRSAMTGAKGSPSRTTPGSSMMRTSSLGTGTRCRAAYKMTMLDAYTRPSIVAGSSRAVTPVSPYSRTTA